jgi:two-component system sensor histidine kinase KdpD
MPGKYDREGGHAAAALTQPPGSPATRPSGVGPDAWPYVVVVAALPVTTAVAWLLRPIAGLENVDLVFLTAIIAVAVRYGLRPSLFASVASVLSYNFFFIPPLYTFAVAEPTNVAALFFFLLVAVITSHLAARARAEANAARERALRTEALHRYGRRVADIGSADELATVAAEQIALLLDLDVVLVLPDEEQRLRSRAGSPAAMPIPPLDLEAVALAWPEKEENRQDVLRLAERLFVPLRAGQRLAGALAVSTRQHRSPAPRQAPHLSTEDERFLGALADQTAVAFERLRLARERDEARLAMETERLRSALLDSLSHDLKTPLASIIGAVTALRTYAHLYDDEARDVLAGTIQDEAERLARFVGNLLDMARIQSGAIVLDRQPVDLMDVVGTALQRMAGVLSDHRVTVVIAPDFPMLSVDATLLEQVLVNLLDNAAKFAPAGSNVTIDGRRDAEGLLLRVIDEGPGLPEAEMERIFEKFYQAPNGDRRRVGAGLGLAICNSFVEALGGTIAAANRPDRAGSVFTITLPETLAVALVAMP